MSEEYKALLDRCDLLQSENHALKACLDMIKETLETLSGEKADHIPPMSYGEWIARIVGMKRQLKTAWTCDDVSHHEHGTKEEARLCQKNDKLREVLKEMGFNVAAPIKDLLFAANIFLEEQKELIEERGKMVYEKFKLREVLKEAINFFDDGYSWTYKVDSGTRLKKKLIEALGEEGK